MSTCSAENQQKMSEFQPPNVFVRRCVPNDHECLFTAIAYLAEVRRFQKITAPHSFIFSLHPPLSFSRARDSMGRDSGFVSFALRKFSVTPKLIVKLCWVCRTFSTQNGSRTLSIGEGRFDLCYPRCHFLFKVDQSG